MKHIIIIAVLAAVFVSCGQNNNKTRQVQPTPLMTYVYDDNKEICLYSGEANRWKPATVDGKSAQWYESEKDFYHSDGISLQTTTRECIYIDRDDVFGVPDMIIWPGTGLVFFGQQNMAASEEDPSNERLGKRCYKKR